MTRNVVKRGKHGRTRRIVASALGAAVALAGAVSAAGSPAPAPSNAAVVDEAALASWTFPTKDAGRARWFFAGAFRDEVAGGRTLTFAFVVRGTCREVRGRRGDGTSCHGRGTGERVPREDFRLDPALRAGRLVFREGGRVAHEVVWEAARRTVPYGYMAGEACSEGTGEGAGMQRPAVAAGRVFGRKVPRDAVDHALLARGAMVTECTRSIPPRTLRRAASGKTVRVFFPNVR